MREIARRNEQDTTMVRKVEGVMSLAAQFAQSDSVALRELMKARQELGGHVENELIFEYYEEYYE